MRVFECRADRKMSVRQLIRERYDMSSNLVTQLKNTGGIKVNGEARMANYMMNEGDLLSLEMIDKPSDIECVNIPIDIVYEDEDIAVINKPPYLPTHISPGHRNDTLSNALMYHFRENNEEHTFRAVNRLDNDTSGLMIAAKNTYSHHKLSVQTSNKILKRKYIAVVCGKTPDSGVIRLPIGRESGSVIKRQVCSWGKDAVTHYKTLGENDGYSICEIELKTGRTHQIRVHFSHIGYPLAGDRMYGGITDGIGRTALHSAYCEFIHPVTGIEMSFSKMPPPDMMEYFPCFPI